MLTLLPGMDSVEVVVERGVVVVPVAGPGCHHLVGWPQVRFAAEKLVPGLLECSYLRREMDVGCSWRGQHLSV